MIIFERKDVGDVIQRLYNSEINIEISSFFDTGYTVKIGDRLNGFGIPTFPNMKQLGLDSSKIEDIMSAFAFWIFEQHPETEFGEWYKANL